MKYNKLKLTKWGREVEARHSTSLEPGELIPKFALVGLGGEMQAADPQVVQHSCILYLPRAHPHPLPPHQPVLGEGVEGYFLSVLVGGVAAWHGAPLRHADKVPAPQHPDPHPCKLAELNKGVRESQV